MKYYGQPTRHGLSWPLARSARRRGWSVTWSGVLAAPNGLAQINANSLRGGSVIAAAIQMSASDLVIS